MRRNKAAALKRQANYQRWKTARAKGYYDYGAFKLLNVPKVWPGYQRWKNRKRTY